MHPIIEEFICRLAPYHFFSRKDWVISWDIGVVSALTFAFMHNLGKEKNTDGKEKYKFSFEHLPINAFIWWMLYYYLMEKYGFSHAALAHITNNAIFGTK